MASSPNYRVKFNVGGTIFETTLDTLKKLGSERLLTFLSKPTDDTGVYFFDRDPEYFRVILNIARYDEVYLHDKNVTLELLEKEAAFFMLGDKCRALIAKYKTRASSEFATIASNSDSRSGLGIRLDLAVEDFTSSKGDFLYHHACLKKKTGILNYLSGEPGFSLVCNINAKCPEVSSPESEPVVCSRCFREFTPNPTTSELKGWCHRCQRCLRCTETFCVPIKM